MGFISLPLVWVQVNLLTFKVALECLYSCSLRFFFISYNFCNIYCVLLARVYGALVDVSTIPWGAGGKGKRV